VSLPFDVVFGIDWSGSKATRLPGLRVAVCTPGDAPPVLLSGPRADGLWRRMDVLGMLVDRIEAGERVLAGFDFAFAYAFEDMGAYFPGLPDAPSDIRALWAYVERLSRDAPDLYGGAVYAAGSPVAEHYLTPAGRGNRYTHRRRATETACAAVTSPHPVFKCVGAANVGTGSLAGMRFLHRLKTALDDRVTVWPFDGIVPKPAMVCEIFPRLAVKQACLDPTRWRESGVVDAVLCHHGSMAYTGDEPLDTEDKADAVMAAAALRARAAMNAVWQAPSKQPAAAREGWIFGVT